MLTRRNLLTSAPAAAAAALVPATIATAAEASADDLIADLIAENVRRRGPLAGRMAAVFDLLNALECDQDDERPFAAIRARAERLADAHDVDLSL